MMLDRADKLHILSALLRDRRDWLSLTLMEN